MKRELIGGIVFFLLLIAFLILGYASENYEVEKEHQAKEFVK